jgi:hypothetical protein
MTKRSVSPAGNIPNMSAIIDLGSSVARRMRVNWAPPDTNLIHPMTAVP